MKLEIKEGSANYTCTVVEIKEVFNIEGADNIKRVVVEGNDAIVSKSTYAGEVMLYFVSGTQLNSDYCFKNNLFDSSEQNYDTTVKGYISHRQRRVKAIKLRGVISNGMLMPLNSLKPFLESAGINSLRVGDAFTDINGNNLCEKYVLPIKTGTQASTQVKVNKMAELIVDNQFKFHTDTAHFVKHEQDFTPDRGIIITRKMHGSSLILARVLVRKKLSLVSRLLKKLGFNIPNLEYGFVWSSGKPKSKMPKGLESEHNKWETANQSYYTSDIWARAYQENKDKLEKGVSLYGEIVGEGIQGAGYTYGKEYAIYIYRITFTSIEGIVHELSWEQVKKYCTKYGLTAVQEYFSGKVSEIIGRNGEAGDLLTRLKEAYLDKSYSDCKVDEGVAIRSMDTDEIFKLKSPKFILHESTEAEKGVENIEDVQ
jgi:RNA ligase (TIGR02306 family)